VLAKQRSLLSRDEALQALKKSTRPAQARSAAQLWQQRCAALAQGGGGKPQRGSAAQLWRRGAASLREA